MYVGMCIRSLGAGVIDNLKLGICEPPDVGMGAKLWSSSRAVYTRKCWLSAQPIYSGTRYKEFIFFFFAKFSLVHFPKLCQIYRASSQNKAIYLTLKEQVIYFLGLQVF